MNSHFAQCGQAQTYARSIPVDPRKRVVRSLPLPIHSKPISLSPSQLVPSGSSFLVLPSLFLSCSFIYRATFRPKFGLFLNPNFRLHNGTTLGDTILWSLDLDQFHEQGFVA